jgi:hypothetical protein
MGRDLSGSRRLKYFYHDPTHGCHQILSGPVRAFTTVLLTPRQESGLNGALAFSAK